MQLPRVRFTVRRTMILVAVAAIAVWGSQLYRRHQQFDRLARDHEVQEALAAEAAEETVRLLLAQGQDPANIEVKAILEVASMRKSYHRAMKEKYRLAAERPWRSVPPDPPEPNTARPLAGSTTAP